MRLTFPGLAANNPYNYCYQAALACLPLVVAYFAKRLFAQTTFFGNPSHASSMLGLATLPTLKDNKWALGGSVILLALYKLYPADRDPTFEISKPKISKDPTQPLPPSEEKPIYYDPLRIKEGATTLITHIESCCINEKGLYSVGGPHSIRKESQIFDALTDLAILRGLDQARKAGALLKNLYRHLEVPLLHPIVDDLRAAKKLEEFQAAIAKLEPIRKEIFHQAMTHLRNVAEKSALNQLDSKILATIFAPVFFKVTVTEPEKAEAEIESLTSALDFLIKNSMSPSSKKEEKPLVEDSTPSPSAPPILAVQSDGDVIAEEAEKAKKESLLKFKASFEKGRLALEHFADIIANFKRSEIWAILIQQSPLQSGDKTPPKVKKEKANIRFGDTHVFKLDPIRVKALNAEGCSVTEETLFFWFEVKKKPRGEDATTINLLPLTLLDKLRPTDTNFSFVIKEEDCQLEFEFKDHQLARLRAFAEKIKQCRQVEFIPSMVLDPQNRNDSHPTVSEIAQTPILGAMSVNHISNVHQAKCYLEPFLKKSP